MTNMLLTKKVEHIQNELNAIKKELSDKKIKVSFKGMWKAKVTENDFKEAEMSLFEVGH